MQAQKLGAIHHARPNKTPLQLALGELESAESHRQAQLLAKHWQVSATPIPNWHHFNMLLEFAEPDSMLMTLMTNLLDG